MPLPSAMPPAMPPANGAAAQPSAQPSTGQQPQQPQQPQGQQPQVNPETTANAPTAAETGAGAEAGVGGGAAESSGGFLGRADANNRFNLFDNNSAYPLNRIFFSYQLAQDFTTGVLHSSASDLNSNFANRREVNLYRLGGEIKLGDNWSISFQDQYIASENTDNAADAWGNPELMLKWAFCLTPDHAVAATLGLQPQVASNNGELHEKDTRFLPGILAYEGSQDSGCFFQQGAQFGLSSSNIATTFDWALMAGYWIYRAEQTEGNKACLSGIAPQIEIFGKHVMVGSQNQPFDIPINGFNTPPTSSQFNVGAPFREQRNVIDITAGARIQLWDKVTISNGFSFPITGGSVRRTEYLASINFLF
jgi:hypothetical protein